MWGPPSKVRPCCLALPKTYGPKVRVALLVSGCKETVVVCLCSGAAGGAETEPGGRRGSRCGHGCASCHQKGGQRHARSCAAQEGHTNGKAAAAVTRTGHIALLN